MIGWLRHQKHAFAAALRRLGAHPVATLLTALAMGVAISLPGGLYLGLGHLDRLAGDLPAQPEISVFLDAGASTAEKQRLAARLQQADIAEARYVPKDDALATLSAAQDLADITAGLMQNPLPDAWVVRPQTTSREELARVAADLGKLPGVAETHLDSQWAARLQAALAIGRTGVWLLAGLFAIALVAISGNAIRAQVLARRDEILVSRLIGATDRYIRRPFLYVGALQGMLGGLAAGGVLAVAGTLLRAPVEHLADLYGSAFHLLPPAATEIVVVLGLTTLFGWLGAWLSVTRALHQVEAAR
ncbi:permease-like cell division protein FtsX [Thiobacillus denitrificans]|uniref:Cell division protein FtsX n=1 Tax=Thiobacillus denitrificans TaxID=36861 RepID=A0A106BRW8_THIDE|nr:permease-like cell division protein FtsX [Thiobacillus denitrificans]KVW97370.1 cell division protein FtsX [Thiobacillus denitrificans]